MFKDARRWVIDDMEYILYSPADKDFYTTDAFTDYALDYLDEYCAEDKPFFLYLAYTAPHYPLHALPEDIAKYSGRYMIGWDELRRQRYSRMLDMGLIDERWKLSSRNEEVPAWKDVDDKDAWDLTMAVYAAMIDRMDQNIGRVLNKLDEQGEADNTVILFLSDNGGCAGQAHFTPDIPPGPLESYHSVDPPWANASNTPFRKYKTWDHEGGICTPFIAHWPGVKQNGGSLTHGTGHIIDIMVTLVDITGAEYPSTFNENRVLPMEGTSQLPAFEGGQLTRDNPIFWQVNPKRSKAVRQGQQVQHDKKHCHPELVSGSILHWFLNTFMN